MDILLFVIGFYTVMATDDGSSSIISPNQGLIQKIFPELDEIGLDGSNSLIGFRSKEGALQRILSSVTFQCKGRFEGYYADSEFGCQTFHYCKQNGLRFTFVCPVDSIFNQKEMTCDHNVSEPHKICTESDNYYYLNAILYAQKKESTNDTQVLTVPLSLNNYSSSKVWPIFEDIKPILNINYTKSTFETIFPFKGFSSLNHKNIGLNKSNQRQSLIEKNIEQNFLKINTKFNKSNDISGDLIQKMKPIITDKTNFTEVLIPLKNSSIETDFQNNITEHIDWDDDETDLKLDRPLQFQQFPYKPHFNDPLSSVNLMTFPATAAPIPLPSLPLPLIKSGPVVVLRPNYIPGTLPIATLYKQTEYMFGKPHVVHKGLYLNQNYGAAIVGAQPISNPSHFVPPISMIASPSDRFNTKLLPKNTNVFSNLQNVLTKFSFNDIFSLNQMSQKRKGTDKNNFERKVVTTPTKQSFNDFYFQRIRSPLHNNRLVFDERLSNEETPVKSVQEYSGIDVPLSTEMSIDFNPRLQPLSPVINPVRSESNVVPKHTKPAASSQPKTIKYSLKLDETMDSVHIITQPSIFANMTSDKKKKWIENYIKIKKKYIEREKKSQQNRRFRQKPNSQPIKTVMTQFI